MTNTELKSHIRAAAEGSAEYAIAWALLQIAEAIDDLKNEVHDISLTLP